MSIIFKTAFLGGFGYRSNRTYRMDRTDKTNGALAGYLAAALTRLTSSLELWILPLLPTL